MDCKRKMELGRHGQMPGDSRDQIWTTLREVIQYNKVIQLDKYNLRVRPLYLNEEQFEDQIEQFEEIFSLLL